MKQVWILNHYAQEPGGAGGTRHYSLAKHLLQHGWCSTILAASVDFNTGRQRLAPQEKRRIDIVDDVPFLWVKTPPYKGNGGGRMLNMLAYSLRVLLPSTTRDLPRPDVIVGSSVHPFAAVSAALLAKRYGVPFVFEVRDLWPQTLVDLGRLKENSLLTRALRWLELLLYHRAEKIIVLLPKAAEYIAPLGVSVEKVVWIPNGVDFALFSNQSPVSDKTVFDLMYFGSIGQANGLDCLIDAMSEVSKMQCMSHVRLRVIGDGPLKSVLVAKVQALNISNVFFDDPVPKNLIPTLAAEADAFVICVRDIPRLYRYGISMNKIYDYLAASRPIIISSSAVNNPVADACAGYTVPADDSIALSDAIVQVVRLPASERIKIGNNGRRFVEEHYNYSSLAVKFAYTLNDLG